MPRPSRGSGHRWGSGGPAEPSAREARAARLGPVFRHPWRMDLPATKDQTDSLWRPDRRALTLGLVLTITLVGFESLAISTVMPIVANELGGLELYGWVFSAFFLGSLIGIVVVGGAIDRGGLAVPFAIGLGLFAIGLLIGGLSPTMPILVGARFLQGLGAGTIQPIAYVAIGRTLPESLRPRMFATLSTAWVLPGVIGPAIAGTVGDTVGWRYVFLGLLPLIALAGALTLGALHAIADVPPPADPARSEARRGRLPLAIIVALGIGAADGRPDDRPAGPDDRPERRRSGARHLRAPSPDATRHPGRPAGPAGRGPAPRRPDLCLLRGRCVRGPDSRGVARAVGDGSRARLDRGDHLVDGRRLDPGPRRDALADPSLRPARVRCDDRRAGRDAAGARPGRAVADRDRGVRDRRARDGTCLFAARPHRPARGLAGGPGHVHERPVADRFARARPSAPD